MMTIIYAFGIPIGLFLGSMGVIKAREMIINIIHAKRGEFQVIKIKPNMRIKKEWRKHDNGFLVLGKNKEDRIPYNDSAGTKLYGGFFGNTPIMYIDDLGNIINFKFEQIYIDVPDVDKEGKPIIKNGKPQMVKHEAMNRKDGKPITSEHIDMLVSLSEAHGRLSAVTDEKHMMGFIYIIVGLLIVISLALGLPMLQGV